VDRDLTLAVFLFVVTLFASCGISLAVLIGLPHDYFRTAGLQHSKYGAHRFLDRAGVVFKNLLGIALILIGAVLSLPGIPGPGLLTILAGIVLVDFPGRNRLLCKLLQRPSLLRSINRLRTAFSRVPLVID
jgi:hypothetical protein